MRLQDFETYKDLEVKLETAMPNANGQKRFRGYIKGLKDETVLLETDTGPEEIPFADLIKAKLVLTEELIKKTANT